MIIAFAFLFSAAVAGAAPATPPALSSAAAPAPSEPSAGAPRNRKLLLSTLLSSLKDQDESIRAKGAEDLGQLKPLPLEAVPDLITALKDRSSLVRNRAAETLLKIGTPKARKAVMDYRKRVRESQSW